MAYYLGTFFGAAVAITLLSFLTSAVVGAFAKKINKKKKFSLGVLLGTIIAALLSGFGFGNGFLSPEHAEMILAYCAAGLLILVIHLIFTKQASNDL